MISGREALHSIDETLGKVQTQIDKTDKEIAESNDRLLAMQQAQADDYRELARVRVDRLDDPEMELHFDQAEQQVRKMLQQRAAALTALDQEIEQAREARVAQETARQQQVDRLDQAIAAVDEAEAVTQERLERDPEYRSQRERAEAAERKAAHADDKAGRSEQEREQKGEAYRQDPLFMYLWERQYGLPGYKAGGLARWLDGKLARFIGFADARANYSRLNEIPQRLREHAEHLAAQAEAEYASLRALDEQAREADGIPALEAVSAEEQAALAGIDEQIARHEQEEFDLLSQKTRFATGDDEHTRQALAFLAGEFEREELRELRRDAWETPYPEDDLVVGRMLQREQDLAQLAAGIEGLKAALAQEQQRLLELQTLRVDFKKNHYDRSGSVFSNESMLPVLLGQFLAGMLDRRMLWKVLREQQRHRPRRSNPGFGSGGLGRGTPWGGGLGGVGDIGDIFGKLGRGGPGGGIFGGGRRGGGGGGFRTGGGF